MIYRAPTQLFVDGASLPSQEETTQGNPLAMPMYTLSTVPLIRSLPDSVTQVWYADNPTALGTVSHLQIWWDAISELERQEIYGYFANPMKTWLVTQNPLVARAAIQAFEGTNINITSDGRPHLGAPLGTHEYADELVAKKVEQWSIKLRSLSNIAESQPHAVYAALIHCLSSKWLYLRQCLANGPICLELFLVSATNLRAWRGILG